MIRDHGDAVEADLAFRGIDLRDLWRRASGLTLRRLALLVAHLPPESHSAKAQGSTGFSNVEMLLMELPALSGGEVHPYHPANSPENKGPSRSEVLQARQAYWDKKREQQKEGDDG